MRLRMAKAWLGASIRSHPQLLEIGCCQRPCTWRTYSSGSNDASSLVVRTASNGVTTLRMNDPKKLNAWTMKMRSTLAKAFAREAADPSTKVMVVTGTDPYYCAGVSFADVLKPALPAELHRKIVQENYATFDTFLSFPKPLIVAVNGPAIGASVTSATLSDAIVASEKATFSTPFAKLNVPKEGCSSVHFERIMGKENAERLLGQEGWVPTAAEAKELGMVIEVTPHDQLMPTAQKIAEEWVRSGRTKQAAFGLGDVEEYRKVNMQESEDLADALMSLPFMEHQYKFWLSKGKSQVAYTFLAMRLSRPLWAWTLPKRG